MTWQPSSEQIALFEVSKQRSAAYTLERRTLRNAMLGFAAELEGAWDCTPAEPCLANRRAVKNLVLYSCPDHAQSNAKGVDLQSPFALDVLPFHESISRFVQIDQSGLTWGMLLHRKAKLDGRNLEAYLKSYEGEQATKDKQCKF